MTYYKIIIDGGWYFGGQCKSLEVAEEKGRNYLSKLQSTLSFNIIEVSEKVVKRVPIDELVPFRDIKPWKRFRLDGEEYISVGFAKKMSCSTRNITTIMGNTEVEPIED